MTSPWKYGWKACRKCGEVIALTRYYPSEEIARELAIREQEHTLHLCLDCVYEFATCQASNITFGDCVGNDNVVVCDKYESREACGVALLKEG